MNMARNMDALLATFLLAAGTALAGEAGTALKADNLRTEPFRDAKTVGSLTAADKVEILKKQGGWFQVKSAKGSGDAAGVLGLASGRAGTGRVVATTGIRGLSEEELKAAKYNERELKKAEAFSATQGEARKFAAEGKLVARKVEYLSAPEAAKGER